MKFKKDTHVYTADEQDVGEVDRVVIDPTTDEVIGLVVRQGLLFTEDKVIPIDLVASATEDRVMLRKTEANLQELPLFEEPYYIPANERDYESENVASSAYVDPLYGYPPLGTAWWGYYPYGGVPPVTYEPDVIERVQQNIPEGTLAIKEGARVTTRDDEHVGNVEEIFTDPETNRATHFVVSQGLLFKERKLIPTNWVRILGEEEVMLNVPSHVVEDLPEYQPA